MATKLKRPIALLLAVTMAMLLNFPSGIFGNIGFGLTAKAAEPTLTAPTVGNGSAESPYRIGTAAELYWFADKVNNENSTYASANAVLTADITVNENVLAEDGTPNSDSFTAWTPIGNYDNQYTGTFDGQGHTISGLYFNDTKEYVGLFGYVGNSGHVLNVGVVDSYFRGGYYVGGVCGYSNYVTIENCYNEGTVSGSSSYVGGVCGKNDNGIIKNCYNEGTVSGDSSNVGGVCGIICGWDSTIENCYNTGTVSGSRDVGGVCGYSNCGTIKKCSNSGTVTGSGTGPGRGEYVGGVCGHYDLGTIESCYNTGSVSGIDYVGGVCGYNVGTITNYCYNTGSVSGSNDSSDVGGVCGFFNDGTIAKCYYLKTDTINKDIYPIGGMDFESSGKAESKTTTDFTDGTICRLVGYHSHQNIICILCGGYEPATLTNNKYDINGDDAPDEVYEISSAGQLYWFAGLVNGDERVCDYDAESNTGTKQNPSANAVLTADITVNSNLLKSLNYDEDSGEVTNGDSFTAWTPIGSYDFPYIGTFDGQGHTISGLYFNDTNINYVGLFGYVGSVTDENDNVISAGKVSNVGVVDAYFEGYDYVGGVCGRNYGTIKNCYNTGSVSDSGVYVGGVCGRNYGTIENCYNTGSVSGSGDYVGGVCGRNNSTGTIENCYNTGSVSGNGSVGGVCGKNYGTIENCYNTGSVSGSGDYVGGVCGYSSDTVQNCYNTGSVEGAYSVGGVCGYNNKGTIENCYNTGAVDGDDDVGSVCGDNNGTVTKCYYLSKTAGSEAKTEAQFASGEVAYLLQSAQTADAETGTIPQVWGQTIGTDTYPVFHNGTNTVYATTGCVTYSNDSETNKKEKDHDYKYGICTGCGKYEEPDKKDGVYQISKLTDLYWLADTVNSGNSSVNAVLTDNIKVNEGVLKADGTLADNVSGFTSWTPIGNYDVPYAGTFDGQGHTISGLYFDDTNEEYVGLFGYIGNAIDENGAITSAGKVSNVGVVDSYFQGYSSVGGVCGKNVGTINGCYTICIVKGEYYVGGVCGDNYGTIKNCYSNNSVSGKKVAIEYDKGNSTNVLSKSTAQFASGEVAYLLNGSKSEGSWGQTLGTDAYPKTHTENNTVYATTGCVTYNNNGETSAKNHDYKDENERCSNCGKYKEPEKDASGVYQISKAADLYWFAEYVNSGNGSVNAVLTDNIKVNEGVLKADGTLADNVSGFTSWTPIGSEESPYIGTFDGQGFKISGLYFNDTDAEYVGLFGCIGNVKDEEGNVTSAGSVSNVGVVDSYFTGRLDVGGVCGANYEGTIENCYNSGTVSGNDCVGGVCGFNGGTIESCYNTGSVSGSGSNYVGGVCGNNFGTIESCYNTGSVSGSGSYFVGGVSGYNGGTITNCYNTAAVSGDSYNVGGVSGRNYNGTIESCYSTGTVSGSSSVGGVCGYNSNGTITSCYYLAESETDDIAGTTYKNTTEFASGEVCYLLNGDQSTLLWGQTIGKESGNDAYPVFHNGSNTVYYGYADCNATDKTYTNIQNDENGHSYTGENHACAYCGNAFATIEVNYAKLANALTDIYNVDSDGNIGDKANVTVDKDTGVVTCLIKVNGNKDLIDTYTLNISASEGEPITIEKTKYKKTSGENSINIDMVQLVNELEVGSYTAALTLYDTDGNSICNINMSFTVRSEASLAE